MGAYWAKIFWSMIIMICIIAICGLLKALCQFCFYICPKIIMIFRYIKDKFSNIYENINCSYSNYEIINKIFIRDIKKATIHPLPVLSPLSLPKNLPV